MTYNEAVDLKKSFVKKTVEKSGFNLRLMVTPLNGTDFKKYITDYRVGGLDDNSAKFYSSDDEYCVRGLWTDGVNVLFEMIN